MVIGYDGKSKLHIPDVTYNFIFIECDKKNYLGNVNNDIDFTYEPNTGVTDSCAASLNGEMWVLGDFNNKRQVKFKLSD